MVGSLIWLSTRTRPDISYAQSRISSMATKAPKRAVLEGLRLLRYLQGTKSIGLIFRKCINHDKVIAYADANFAVERSQSGTVVKLGINTVTWGSPRQPATILSTVESEVQAAANTGIVVECVKT